MSKLKANTTLMFDKLVSARNSAIPKVLEMRTSWVRNCDDRPHLQDAEPDERHARFGIILLNAYTLAKLNIVPGQYPGDLLDALSTLTRKDWDIGASQGFFLNSLGATIVDIPGFDREKLFTNEPQTPEFMEQFQIDADAIRNLSFEMRKLLHFSAYAEIASADMESVSQGFLDQCMSGVDLDLLECILSGAEGLEKSQETTIDQEYEITA